MEMGMGMYIMMKMASYDSSVARDDRRTGLPQHCSKALIQSSRCCPLSAARSQIVVPEQVTAMEMEMGVEMEMEMEMKMKMRMEMRMEMKMKMRMEMKMEMEWRWGW